MRGRHVIQLYTGLSRFISKKKSERLRVLQSHYNTHSKNENTAVILEIIESYTQFFRIFHWFNLVLRVCFVSKNCKKNGDNQTSDQMPMYCASNLGRVHLILTKAQLKI